MADETARAFLHDPRPRLEVCGELLPREIRFGFRGREVGPEAFQPQVGRSTELADESYRVAGRRAQAVHAGIHLHMHSDWGLDALQVLERNLAGPREMVRDGARQVR